MIKSDINKSCENEIDRSVFMSILNKIFYGEEDYRKGKNIVYSIPFLAGCVFFIELFGVGECGYRIWEATLSNHAKRLSLYLLKDKFPNKDTLSAFMNNYSSDCLDMKFNALYVYLEKNHRKLYDELISVTMDGKVPSNFQTLTKEKLNIVTAMNADSKVCIIQVVVPDKKNELAAYPVAIDKSIQHYPNNTIIFTIDAMGTNNNICKIINDKSHIYILPIKNNQGRAFKEAQKLAQNIFPKFDIKCKSSEIFEEKNDNVKYSYYKPETFSRNGKVVIKKFVQIDITDAEKFPQFQKFDGISTLMLERTESYKTSKGEKNGDCKVEFRYFISNCQMDIERESQEIRKHWSIESLHWVIDRIFKEDNSMIKNRNAIRNRNIFIKLVNYFLSNYIKNHKKETKSKSSLGRKLIMTNLQFSDSLLDNVLSPLLCS